MKVAKHQHVTYRAPLVEVTISAIVRRVHRDGTVTVEARFVLDKDGNATGGYLNHRYRISAKLLSPAGGVAEILPIRRSA